jgi:hypothetical protein
MVRKKGNLNPHAESNNLLKNIIAMPWLIHIIKYKYVQQDVNFGIDVKSAGTDADTGTDFAEHSWKYDC